MVDLKNKKRAYYDNLVGASRDFSKQIDWLDNLFRKYNVKTIIDCGCGTGTHAVLLAKKGYNVTAFDYSKEMVNLAKKKAKENKVNIRFHVGDIKDFNFGKFDAATSFFAPIMFGCKNQKELTQAVKSIKNSLNPGGIALIETMNSMMMQSSGLEINKHTEKDFKIARLSFYTFNKKSKSAKIKYVYVSQKNNKISYDEAEGEHNYFDKKDFEKAFKKTNSKVIKWYGIFNNKKGKYEPFDTKTQGMITPLFKRNKKN